MLPRPLTLRGRLIAALLVFSAVGLAIFAGASELLLRHSLLSRADEQLHHFPLHRIAAAERPNPQRLPSDYRLAVLARDGTIAYELGQQPGQLGGPALPGLDLAAVRQRGGRPFTVSDRAGGSAWRVEAVELPDNGIVAVALSLGSVEVILRQLLIIEAIVGGIVLFLVGGVATIVVRLGLRPLTRIERTAEAIAGGELDRRVPDSDPRTETGRLGAALNVMLGRLADALHERERSEDRLRQFVADASHELRTPLTSIRGFAELYRRGGARTPAEIDLLTGRIESEATRMGVLVEDLLLLARLDQQRALDITDVDLLVLAADAVHDAKAREPDRRVTLIPGTDSVHVLGDEHKRRPRATIHRWRRRGCRNCRPHRSVCSRFTTKVPASHSTRLRMCSTGSTASIPAAATTVVARVSAWRSPRPSSRPTTAASSCIPPPGMAPPSRPCCRWPDRPK
jgi:two-component system OmpR family sensor kinase